MTPTQADITAAITAVRRALRHCPGRIRVTVGGVTIEVDPLAPAPPAVPASAPGEIFEGEHAAAEWIKRRAAGGA